MNYSDLEGVDIPVVGDVAPSYANAGDAGADLTSSEDVLIPAGERRLVGTGTRIMLPEQTVGLLCSRSGLAHSAGLFVLNAPGIIDQGYTGEIKVNLMNLGTEDYQVTAGDRIAQLVVQPSVQFNFNPMSQEDFDGFVTERGDGGHGSSGQ